MPYREKNPVSASMIRANRVNRIIHNTDRGPDHAIYSYEQQLQYPNDDTFH